METADRENQRKETPAPSRQAADTMTISAQLVSFNRCMALERVGGDEELLREVVQLFLTEYPELFGQLTRAVEYGDATQVERSAHTLKGSLSTIGAEIAAHNAFMLEVMGRTRQLEGAGDQLRRLSQALSLLCDELARASYVERPRPRRTSLGHPPTRRYTAHRDSAPARHPRSP